jgi:drug/metabolite transporter (DMT)-like permease
VGSVAALIGLVLVLDLAGAHHVDLAGVLWGLGAAVGLAVYFVIASGANDALPPLMLAWGGLAVGAIVLALAIAAGVLPMHATRADVSLLDHKVSWIVPVAGMAVVAGAVAYVTGIAAARLLGARLASFVGLTEVLFAVVFAWLLLRQRLDAVQLAGGVLVVAGIALVRIDELRLPTARELTLPPAEPQLAGADL